MKDINKNIDTALAYYFIEVDSEDISQYLDTEISNKDEYFQKKEKHLKKINFLARATANKYKDEILLNQVADKLQAISSTVANPLTYLNNLFKGQTIPAYYRNLNQLSKEDIIEIIKDKNLIELLETLERDENKY